MVSQKRYSDNCIDFDQHTNYNDYLSDSQMMMAYEKSLLTIIRVTALFRSAKTTEMIANEYTKSKRKNKIEKSDMDKYIKRVMRKFKILFGSRALNIERIDVEFIYYNLLEQHYSEVIRIKIIALEKQKNQVLPVISDFYNVDEENKKFDRRNNGVNYGDKTHLKEERLKSKLRSLMKSKTNPIFDSTKYSSNNSSGNDNNNKNDSKNDSKNDNKSATKSSVTNSKNINSDKPKDNCVFNPILPYPVGSVIANVELTVLCDQGENTELSNLCWKFQGVISEHSELNWIVTSVRLINN